MDAWAARLGLLAAGLAGRARGFEYLPRFACGVCKELRSGLPCEPFGACNAGNLTEAALGCSSVCPAERESASITGLELRVSKALGTKAYNLVRITAITSSPMPPEGDFFDYSAQFVHRWQQFFLHTALKEMKVGVDNHFAIAGEDIVVRVPQQGTGVAGLLIADPCVNSPTGKMWIPCSFGSTFNTIENTPLLINTFTAGDAIDFWSISGDNFYDRTGDITADVYSRISTKAKSKIFAAVPGNHDYWALGDFLVGTKEDQCGNGFMQWYGQDTLSASTLTPGSRDAPFDFSIDPGEALPGSDELWWCNRSKASNFLWFNQVGNLGMVGQSGAYDYNATLPFMKQACSWAAAQIGLEVLLLFGHWDTQGLGASAEMAMPQWYTEMSALPGCADFNDRGMLKFVMGHTHCNDPHPHGKVGAGFRVAGFGMEGCGNYGMPIVDTTENRVRFWYFDTSSHAKLNSTVDCVSQKGWRACTSMATLWLDQPINRTKAHDQRIVI